MSMNCEKSFGTFWVAFGRESLAPTILYYFLIFIQMSQNVTFSSHGRFWVCYFSFRWLFPILSGFFC